MRTTTRSALLMRELWNKRVALVLEVTAGQGVQFVKVKDTSPMIWRMSPLYVRYPDHTAGVSDHHCAMNPQGLCFLVKRSGLEG